MNAQSKSVTTGGHTKRILTGLVGDIGGTNARFALARRHVDDQGDETNITHFQTVECSGFSNVYEAIKVYYDLIGERPELDFCVLAMAGPVKDGQIKLTNLPWLVSETELQKQTGAKVARLINDFAGVAYSLPHLKDADTISIGAVAKNKGNVHAVFGAGTGFGAAVLVGGPFGPYCLSTESGHATFAPVNDFEAEIHKVIRKKFGRVTIEHILSGQGLVNLYEAIAQIRGDEVRKLTPAQITALEGGDTQGCRHTVDAFIDILASVAGDLALYHGANAGIFIAGGITPRLVQYIDQARFRARMEAKAPLHGFVASIPSKIITHPYAALLGAANALTPVQIPL
jgi:glucokinase